MKILILILVMLVSYVSVNAQAPELMVEAKSEVVKHGEIYEARIRLINVKYTSVRYEASGRALGMDETGAGILKFKAVAGAYDRNGEAFLNIKITAIYKQDGEEKTIAKYHRYKVIR